MFNFFKKKKEPENLKEILAELNFLKEKVERVFQELEKMRKENQFSIQKVGIVRFNPFKEIGGNQSFSIALLDGNNSGVVITSLYSRQENRFYGKVIKNGKSDYFLSEEEKEAIKMAQERSLWKNENETDKKRKIRNQAAGSSGFGTY
jgi:hypothetical protein